MQAIAFYTVCKAGGLYSRKRRCRVRAQRAVADTRPCFRDGQFQADGVSKSETDRHIGNYFVIWGVLNVFIGGFLGGLTQLYTLALDPGAAP